MIKIIERKPNKMPGLTTLFVSFNYKPQIVEAVKSIGNASYNKDTKEWEVPVSLLSKLLDTLTPLDDITLDFLEDEQKKEHKEIVLSQYKTNPYDYQKDGIKYGLEHDKWLLLDAPGLGKTLQLIYLAQELKQREGIEHCLIICGINTLKNNWKSEIQKHSDLSCRILGERVNTKGRTVIGSVQERLEELKKPIKEFFIITNIETLRNDDIAKQLDKGKNKFDMIVLDEAHTCKSPTSEQGKNLLKLKSAKYKVAATGTILLNSPLDAYVPLKWIGVEQSTFTNFKYYYCNYTGTFNNILLGYKNVSVLKNMLETCSLRRTKDLLDLPPKNIIHEYVDMDVKQSDFYANIRKGVVDEVDKVDMSNTTILSMIGRLRQATACPSMLTTENIPSAKLERAIDLIEQITSNGEKVVVFSTFKETLNVLKTKIENFKPLLCTGDVDDGVVAQNIEKFQNDNEHMVLLCTIQKMGTGITLTRASYEIFIDCAYTQAQNLQAEDRCYRIGSKNPVFVYYLWTKGTVDERVKEIVDSKAAVADYVVDNKVSMASMKHLKKYIEELSDGWG